MSPRRATQQPMRGVVRVMRIDRCSKCGAEREVFNGAYLRLRREAHQLSLRDVARQAKLSAAFLSDVENNRRNASDRALWAYINAGVLTVQDARLA